jgi:hypothetical protein
LPGQPDYNRIWPGGEADDSPEARMMAEVVAVLHKRGLFASVDVHNNTGLNPHYACINRVDDRFSSWRRCSGARWSTSSARAACSRWRWRSSARR